MRDMAAHFFANGAVIDFTGNVRQHVLLHKLAVRQSLTRLFGFVRLARGIGVYDE